jgi:hypothetical protein
MALEGELPARELHLINEHLNSCWNCRRQVDTFQRGIFTFVDYHRDVLEEHVPPPPPTKNGFYGRLHARASETTRLNVVQFPGARWINSATRLPQSVGISAIAAVAAIAIFLLLPVARPPVVSAGEFLTRANQRENEERFEPRKTRHRRLEIRQGPKRIERNFYSGSVRAGLRDASPVPYWLHSALPSQLSTDDSLIVQRFSQWRAALARSEDGISETEKQITLMTTAQIEGPVRAISITVRKSDWHAVAERIDLQNQPPIEITELFSELISSPEVPSVDRIVKPRSAEPEAAPERAVATPPGLTEDQLETMEADARWKLHSINAGLTGEEGPIQITRGPTGILIKTITDTDVRRDAIKGALKDMPGVTVSVRTIEDSAEGGEPSANVTVEDTQVAPLQRAPLLRPQLVATFASERLAVDRGNKIRALSDTMTTASGALMELAERYPNSAFDRLPDEARAKIISVVKDLVNTILSSTKQQEVLFEPILRSSFPELRSENPASGIEVGTQTCVRWQQAAASMQACSNSNSRLSNRMFAVVRSDDTDNLSPRGSVRDWIQSQSRLFSLASHLCE